jgi:alpha-1,2-mannosyltransferase
MWDAPYKTHRVYPPCEVNHLKEVCHVPSSDEKVYILSVGQYRPEKDHAVKCLEVDGNKSNH